MANRKDDCFQAPLRFFITLDGKPTHLIQVKMSNDSPARGFHHFGKLFSDARQLQLVKNIARETSLPKGLLIKQVIPWLAQSRGLSRCPKVREFIELDTSVLKCRFLGEKRQSIDFKATEQVTSIKPAIFHFKCKNTRKGCCVPAYIKRSIEKVLKKAVDQFPAVILTGPISRMSVHYAISRGCVMPII